MPIKPTDFETLRTDVPLSYREALVAAAVLPNLPDDEVLIRLTGHGSGYLTDEDTVEHFKRHHTPIVNGSDVYRVARHEDDDKGHDLVVEPVPHGRRRYKINYGDVRVIKPTDPEEYDFDDTPQATLTDFGDGSPYFLPYYKIGGEYDRKPRLPV